METHTEADLIVKFLFAVIFICFVIGYAIYRWISNQRTSNYSARLVKTLDNSPELANEVATDYQNQYAKVPKTGGKPLAARLASIQRGEVLLQKYQVLATYPLHKDGVLLVTICRNSEIGESNGSEVIKKYSFNFVAQHNASSGEFEVCSDYYELLKDRFLRQDFAMHLATLIERNG